MPIVDPRIYDGYSGLQMGMDGGRWPHLIDPNQVADAENAIFRGGVPTNRPPFIGVALDFVNPNVLYLPDGMYGGETGGFGMDVFQHGTFQGADFYASPDRTGHLECTIGGRLYEITPTNSGAKVREIRLPWRNSALMPLNYMVQAETYLIIQDGQAAPIIYDGVAARRAAQGEVFTGTIMGYGQGRIVLIGTDGSVNFGDIFNGKGNGAVDVLGFTEATFLNEGFPSALPSTLGKPTGVAFIPAQDTATGVGECIVTGEKGVEAFNLGIPRETWKDSQFQRTAMLGAGNLGHRNLAVINQDLFMHSHDGWRSYRQARAQVNEWAQIPLSTNIRKWTESDTPSLLKYGSAMNFNNRLIATCTPYPNQGRFYHNGAVSLDFDILSSFGKHLDPAWDGHWTNPARDPYKGLKVLQFVEGSFDNKRRAFAFVINNLGQNALVELMAEAQGEDSAGTISSAIDLRSLDFQREFNEKTLYGGDIWIDGVEDSSDVTVSYRPDQHPEFHEWHSFTVDNISGATEGDAPVELPGFAPRKALPKPDNSTDTLATDRILRRGFEFQPRIEWTGRAVLRKFRAHAKEIVEESKAKV